MSSKYTSEPETNKSVPELLDIVRRGHVLPYMAQLKAQASMGDIAATMALGHIFFKGGRGVRKDYVAARHWLEKVSLEDDVTGFVANRLATIYYRGLGVPANHHKAYRYLRSAILHGHSNSRVLLAILNKKGDGTRKKPHAAHVLLKAGLSDPKASKVMRFLALVWLP